MMGATVMAICGSKSYAADAEGGAATPTVHISQDGRSLIVAHGAKSMPTHVAVLSQCGDPAVGEPKIRQLITEHDHAIAVYGKHCFATLSLKTLVLECTGCD